MGYHPMGYQGYYPEERTLAAQPAQTLFRPTTCFGCEPTTPRLVWKAFLPPAAHRVPWLREPAFPFWATTPTSRPLLPSLRTAPRSAAGPAREARTSRR